jgi:hypothetical protein
MANKTKLAFDLLEQEMEVICKEEQVRFTGGSGSYTYEQLVAAFNSGDLSSIPAGSYIMNSENSFSYWEGSLNEVVVFSRTHVVSSGGGGSSWDWSNTTTGGSGSFWFSSNGYVDGGGSTGGGSSTQTDPGLDMTNVVLDLSGGNELFNAQLNGILTSNSVIAKLLNSATKGDNGIVINIGQLQPNTPGSTGIAGNTSVQNTSQGLNQIITLDVDLVTSTGMFDLNYIDTAGLNHGSLTASESLVAIIAHEAFHAYSNAAYISAQVGSNEQNYNCMLENGVPQGLVNIYYTTTIINGETIVSLNDGNCFAENEHNYMKTSDFTYVNDAIAEYRANNY